MYVSSRNQSLLLMLNSLFHIGLEESSDIFYGCIRTLKRHCYHILYRGSTYTIRPGLMATSAYAGGAAAVGFRAPPWGVGVTAASSRDGSMGMNDTGGGDTGCSRVGGRGTGATTAGVSGAGNTGSRVGEGGTDGTTTGVWGMGSTGSSRVE
jgi:hypothetical protein